MAKPALEIIVSVTLFLVGTCGVQAQGVPLGILLAAGDIVTCSGDDTRSGKATADLIGIEIAKAKLQNIEARVLALGDLAYDHGAAKSFDCFDATWGKFKDKILPVPGNHDYETLSGGPYRKYFEATLNSLKADKLSGFYSVEFPTSSEASWLLIGLNSNVSTGSNSEQAKWLESELIRTKMKRCVLAFTHGFFYSSGRHGHDDGTHHPQNGKIDLSKPLLPGAEMRAMFGMLYDHRASVFAAGHDHHFEQLGRANALGNPADRGTAAMTPDGVRSFVVGTGGKALYPNDYLQKWAFTEAYDLNSYGILKIELYPDSYRWEFIPTKPNSASIKVVHDIKTDTCNRS
jgi:hypothetical protein